MTDLFSVNSQATKVLPFVLPAQDGFSYEYIEALDGFNIIVPNGELFYAERFFNQKLSDRSMDYFLESNAGDWRNIAWHSMGAAELNSIAFARIPWRQDKLNMYGKEVYLPRFSSWHGNNDKPYTYSGLTLQPNAWNDGLLHLKNRIEIIAGINFNSVLMNWYRNGDDHLSWHTDAEKELGKNPIIASANFGETRDFMLRRNDNHSCKLSIPLRHGTLLIMRGELQHFWQHCVPARKKVTQSRINLTFREIIK